MDRRTLIVSSLTALALPFEAYAQTQAKSLAIAPRNGELAGTTAYTNSFAVLVGITYGNLPADLQIKTAQADVQDLKKLLVDSYGFLSDNVTVLLDAQATRKNIEKALSQLADRKRVLPTDRVLVYFTCHGQTIKTQEGGDTGFLIPADAEIDLKSTDDPVPYLRDCLAMDGLWKYLESCPARHRLLIADACFGGLIVSGKAFPKPSAATLKGFLAVPALQAIAAGGKGEEALILPGLRNSAFTHKLLEVLRQSAASGEVVAASQLGAHLKTSVPDLILAKTNGKFRQTPQFGSRGTEGEFLFVSLEGGATAPTPVQPVGEAVVEVKNTVGRLVFAGLPVGAAVTVDGKAVSGAAYEEDMSAEKRSVEVVATAPGYRRLTGSTTLERGKALRVNLPLEKLPAPAAPALPAAGKGKFVSAAATARGNQCPELAAYLEAMCEVPGGPFKMGSSSGEGSSDEVPEHMVHISGFWVGRTEVTVALWREYAKAKLGGEMPAEPISYGNVFNPNWSKVDHPIVKVSWNDIVGEDMKGGFCAWASAMSGVILLLPTEAQWEKAARGTDGRLYPWGKEDPSSDLLWSSKSKLGDAGGTTPVGRFSKGASPYGCLDMAGNVWEWCLDWFADGFYRIRQAEQPDPVNHDYGEKKERVIRGGSWVFYDVEDTFRGANRFKWRPNDWYNDIGFRLASPGP